MGMSVNLHANTGEKFRTKGYVTEGTLNTEPYAVIGVSVGEGYEVQDITIFLTQEQVHQLKLTLCQTDRTFKRYLEKQALMKEVNE
jgi:hypothetical protein